MGNKLYVGNLAYSIRDDDLQQAFAQFGVGVGARGDLTGKVVEITESFDVPANCASP